MLTGSHRGSAVSRAIQRPYSRRASRHERDYNAEPVSKRLLPGPPD